MNIFLQKNTYIAGNAGWLNDLECGIEFLDTRKLLCLWKLIAVFPFAWNMNLYFAKHRRTKKKKKKHVTAFINFHNLHQTFFHHFYLNFLKILHINESRIGESRRLQSGICKTVCTSLNIHAIWTLYDIPSSQLNISRRCLTHELTSAQFRFRGISESWALFTRHSSNTIQE